MKGWKRVNLHRAVVAYRFAILDQGSLPVLASNDEASFIDARKNQDTLGFLQKGLPHRFFLSNPVKTLLSFRSMSAFLAAIEIEAPNSTMTKAARHRAKTVLRR
jgi:hypothetical protein